MPRRGFARLAMVVGIACAASLGGATARGGDITGSPLALVTVRPQHPAAADVTAERASGLFLAEAAAPLLAQRVITREWGESEDSVYVEFDVPGYKSEGMAILLSAAVPGAGQYYVGEGSAWLFALAEVAGWVSRWSFRDQARKFQEKSLDFAGSPYDSTSNWSFARYANATANPDTTALQQLFAGDRDAFYHRIGFDDRYRLGWGRNTTDLRGSYQNLENKYQHHLKRARYASGAIILTHVIAAIEALHAARKNNLPLKRNLRLRLEGSLGLEGEAMFVAFERRF